MGKRESAEGSESVAVVEELRQSHEAWALAAGMLPQWQTRSLASRPNVNPDYWRHAAAVASSGWQAGQLMTAEEFQAAVRRATTEPL